MALSQGELRKFYEYIEACKRTIEARFDNLFVELDAKVR